MKTIQLYEAGEGVSAALARINPGRGRAEMSSRKKQKMDPRLHGDDGFMQ